MRSKRETIRRLIVGDFRKVLRHRCGTMLPDDDAGREYLYLLLRLAALSPKAAAEKMQHEIELYAPWAGNEERQWVDDLAQLDPRRIWLSGEELGKRIRLTNSERERLKAWCIAPVHLESGELLTPAERAEQRRVKKKTREAARRLERGCIPRQAYEAKSLSQRKPWVAEGICRRTWERRRVASPCPTILTKLTHTCDNRSDKLRRPKAYNKNRNGKEAQSLVGSRFLSTCPTLATQRKALKLAWCERWRGQIHQAYLEGALARPTLN